MSVQAPASNVSFFCPTTVATTFEFRCNATVLSGTYMDMSVDYDDGVVEKFPIAGQCCMRQYFNTQKIIGEGRHHAYHKSSQFGVAHSTVQYRAPFVKFYIGSCPDR